MKITVKKKLKEISAMGGGAVAGHVDSREKKDLDEISQASGLTGYNLFPKASAEDEHEGHVERSKHQKIKNVMEKKKNTIKIKVKKNLKEKKDRRGASPSYCKSTPCKKMGFTQKASCKSQGIKDCYREKKKN